MLKQMSTHRLCDLKYSTFHTSLGRNGKYRVIIQEQKGKKKASYQQQPQREIQAKTLGHSWELSKNIVQVILCGFFQISVVIAVTFLISCSLK